jgi:hypothetical protein
MDQKVAERDNLSKLRDLRGKLRIRPRQLCQRFTDYFEFSFDRRMENDIPAELAQMSSLKALSQSPQQPAARPTKEPSDYASNSGTRERSNSAFK